MTKFLVNSSWFIVNYKCGFNQLETGKYFEWIIMVFINLMWLIGLTVLRDWICTIKTGDVPQFSNLLVLRKYIWRILNTLVSIWRENMLRCLFLNITYSSKLENCSLLGTDDVCEQIRKDLIASSTGYCLYVWRRSRQMFIVLDLLFGGPEFKSS